MSATGDHDGGMAVWPSHLGAVAGAQEFVSTRPRSCPPSREHRVFSYPRTRAMLELVNGIGDLYDQVNGRMVDHDVSHARVTAAMLQLVARYREAILPPEPEGVTEVDFLFDGPPGADRADSGQFIDTVLTDGSGCAVGEWIEMGDVWALRVRVPVRDVRRS